MSEKPILFNTEMVQAILEGRKTQTRRPIKDIKNPHNLDIFNGNGDGLAYEHSDSCSGYCEYGCDGSWHKSPFLTYCEVVNLDVLYVEEGEHRLWVRETFYSISNHLAYRADYSFNPFKESEVDDFCPNQDYSMIGEKWTPSIHMPRSASRINLKVKRVWIERVQDITEEDVTKEGIAKPSEGDWKSYDEDWPEWEISAKRSFASLWDSIYKPQGLSWDSNPWVWACEFEVMP
ncbi:MAG: hypothetical protein NE330_15110 [Lentisphaeraceae bacterium]|nr:hypothetical protein [Lentisphaeraceae bacterium]